MSKLDTLSIKNVKGIQDKLFHLDLHPNKPSILVAPNGFGKSSIACAFNSLNNARIDLEDKDFPNADKSLPPEINLRVSGTDYVATGSSNDISKSFDVFVIKNSIYAKTVKKNMGRFVSATSTLEVEPVTLIDTVPAKSEFNYSVSTARAEFGAAGKVLPSISSLLSDPDFMCVFESTIDASEFTKKRTFKTPLESIVGRINQQSGSVPSIYKWIEVNELPSFDAINCLKELADLIKDLRGESDVAAYLLAIQIAEASTADGFKEALDYIVYLKDKRFFDALISSLNTTRHKISAKEEKKGTKKSLVVNFPGVVGVSNGQRDILAFIAQIHRIKRKFKKQSGILIIDEIFDYLDDANLMAFQYYITAFICDVKACGKSIYPMLLTHLDPEYFGHFCFNKHALQVRYLQKDLTAKKSVFIKLVKHRRDERIENNVSKHFFHFNPHPVDLTSEFNAIGLPSAWARSDLFYEKIYAEVDKYIKGSTYDPLAILFSTRLKIEQLAFDMLSTQKLKDYFISVHKTVRKLEFCLECGLDIPETHFLLGIIYNDDLHWRENKDYETPLRSKLENVVVRSLISELFKA